MARVLINQYLADPDRLKSVSGEEQEGIVSEAFKDLPKGWGRKRDLVFVPQFKLDTLTREERCVDGALLHELRVPFGYWEAKDSKDDLDAEIAGKFKRGYPQDNIVFEVSTQAVLIQHGQEVMRCGVTDVAALEKLLRLFLGFERGLHAQRNRARHVRRRRSWHVVICASMMPASVPQIGMRGLKKPADVRRGGGVWAAAQITQP